MRRLFIIAIAILCVPAFILGHDKGIIANEEGRLEAAATAKANETGKPELAYIKKDGDQEVRSYRLPTVPQWPEFYDQSGNFVCPDPPRLKGETRDQWFRKWAKMVVPFVASKYGWIIDKASAEHDVLRERIIAKIVVESCGDPGAVSSAKAKGLMQLDDMTAKEMGVQNIFDPTDNIMGGTKYFRYLVNRYKRVDVAMVAYNRGPGGYERDVKRRGLNPSKQDYVKKIKMAMKIARSI